MFGTPAKGAVTIYNKILHRIYRLTKGTVLTNGDLQFTLTLMLMLASASESFNETQGTPHMHVYCQYNCITNWSAKQYACEHYLYDSGISSDAAAARNSTALSGGTSKQ